MINHRLLVSAKNRKSSWILSNYSWLERGKLNLLNYFIFGRIHDDIPHCFVGEYLVYFRCLCAVYQFANIFFTSMGRRFHS